jgi:hypothetical protein
VMIRMFPPCPEVFDVRADERKAELQVHHLSDAGTTPKELPTIPILPFFFFLLRRMACHVCIMSIIYLENIERGGKDIHLPRRLQMPGKEKIPSATRCPSSCAAK